MSDKTVAQKLLLKPGQRFMLLNAPEGYRALLDDLPAGVEVVTTAGGKADVVQCFVSAMSQLEELLPTLKAALGPKGILWISYPKLTSRMKGDLSRDTIRAAAERVGLQGVAMFAIDEDWSALRLKVG